MDALFEQTHATAAVSARYQSVCAAQLSARDAADYSDFMQTASSGHYSQSLAWAAVAVAGRPFTPTFFMLRKDGRVIGAALVLRSAIAGVPLPFAQVERGPVCDKRSDLPVVLEALRQALLRRGVVRLSVMPYWSSDARAVDLWLEAHGFADRQSFATRHARSLRLDLTQMNAAEPFAAADLAKVRQAVRRAQRAGATARLGTRADMAAFRRLNEALITHQGGKSLPDARWYKALEDYFCSGGSQGALFISEFEGEAIAAALVTLQNGLATYALGASTPRNFKFPKMVLPMAQALLWAKAAGAVSFDMGGIPLKGDPDPKRASIAEFKYAFSHTEISLVREHVRWF